MLYSPWRDIYRSVCRSPWLVSNARFIYLFIGSHLPRLRGYCRIRIRIRTRRGGYWIRIQRTFKKSMWVLTRKMEFLFMPRLYHRRAKKWCSFKTQTPRQIIASLCVSIDWYWNSSNALIHRIQSTCIIPHHWLWTGLQMMLKIQLT